MTSKENSDDKAGYCRPPKQYQFKKGKSGNPRGRPKRDYDNSFIALVQKAVNEYVTVQEGGQRKRVKKKVAAAKQIANKAASGDYRAVKILIEIGQSPVWTENDAASSNAVDEVRAKISAKLSQIAERLKQEDESENSNPDSVSH